MKLYHIVLLSRSLAHQPDNKGEMNQFHFPNSLPRETIGNVLGATFGARAHGGQESFDQALQAWG